MRQAVDVQTRLGRLCSARRRTQRSRTVLPPVTSATERRSRAATSVVSGTKRSRPLRRRSYLDGVLDIDSQITHRSTLAEINKGFDRMARGEAFARSSLSVDPASKRVPWHLSHCLPRPAGAREHGTRARRTRHRWWRREVGRPRRRHPRSASASSRPRTSRPGRQSSSNSSTAAFATWGCWTSDSSPNSSGTWTAHQKLAPDPAGTVHLPSNTAVGTVLRRFRRRAVRHARHAHRTVRRTAPRHLTRRGIRARRRSARTPWSALCGTTTPRSTTLVAPVRRPHRRRLRGPYPTAPVVGFSRAGRVIGAEVSDRRPENASHPSEAGRQRHRGVDRGDPGLVR